MSPKLFTLALEDVFKTIDWKDKGININGEYINNLRYADDVIVIAKSYDELQTMLTELEQQSKKIGLKINRKKTKVMVSSEEQRQITLETDVVEQVKNYIYLGQEIRLGKENQTVEVNRRIRLGWAAFGKLSFVLKNSKIQQHLRSKVFDMCILPVLTYGTETWVFTRKNIEKMAKTQRAMERAMLGISLKDRVTNENIRHRTKITDVKERMARLKWQWAGHNERRQDERWNNIIHKWRPWEGKRGRGRPQMRWGDDLKRIGGFGWTRKARNRQELKNLEKAYVQYWTS